MTDFTISPVRLKYAISQSFGVSGVSVAYTYVKVKVQNLDSDKKAVDFVYKKPDGTWDVKPLVLEANYGDYELFELTDAPHTEEFAISYTIDGDAYWDSNNGINYKLLTNIDNTIGGKVILNKATARNEPKPAEESGLATVWLEGEIYVKKLSYSKNVGVRFSLNNGETWSQVEANYQGVEIEGSYAGVFNTAVEVWKFKTPSYDYNSCADELKLVVYYNNQETGDWYWENNFGQDYKISKVDGSTIE